MVKNSRKAAKEDFIAEMRCLASQVTPDIADRVSLITERHLDPIEVHNAELIHSVRLPDPEADAAVRRVVAGLIGAVKIKDIVAAAGCSGRGFLAVVRMIRKHELELVAHERIEPEVLGPPEACLMLDFAPSPQTPRFTFDKHDKVTIGSIAYRPVDMTDAGYVFVRLDGQGVAESFSRAEISRLVDLGRVVHEREACYPRAPEHASKRRANFSRCCPPKCIGAQEERRLRFSLSLRWREAGDVNRTDDSINAAKRAIKGGGQ